MGIVKNIMYWGVFTGIIISWFYRKVCTKINFFQETICAILVFHSTLYLKLPHFSPLHGFHFLLK